MSGGWQGVKDVRQVPPQGRAVQIDPIKPTLKPPETKRLKLNCDARLTKTGFKFNLRRYSKATTSNNPSW